MAKITIPALNFVMECPDEYVDDVQELIDSGFQREVVGFYEFYEEYGMDELEWDRFCNLIKKGVVKWIGKKMQDVLEYYLSVFEPYIFYDFVDEDLVMEDLKLSSYKDIKKLPLSQLKDYINVDDFIEELVGNYVIFESSVGWVKIE